LCELLISLCYWWFDERPKSARAVKTTEQGPADRDSIWTIDASLRGVYLVVFASLFLVVGYFAYMDADVFRKNPVTQESHRGVVAVASAAASVSIAVATVSMLTVELFGGLKLLYEWWTDRRAKKKAEERARTYTREKVYGSSTSVRKEPGPKYGRDYEKEPDSEKQWT